MPMKSTLELKRQLEAQGFHLGKAPVPRVPAKDMEHIDDPWWKFYSGQMRNEITWSKSGKVIPHYQMQKNALCGFCR